MVKITSKYISALRGTPRIHEHPFEAIQEDLNGIHPLDSKKKTYDTGKPRMTIPDMAGLGPDNLPESQGDKDVHTDLSSGYNRGSDAEGPPKDDSGPGYSNAPTDPYYGSWAFNNPNDPTMTDMFKPINMDSKRKQTRDLHKLYSQQPVMWSKRYPVK